MKIIGIFIQSKKFPPIMDITLNINETTCIRCGRCVAVCPSRIFTQAAPRAEIGTRNIQTCIVCGHCVAACPTDSVRHSAFPGPKVHAIDRNALPTPEQVMLLIKSRRSNRAFAKEPVPREKLEQIVEAAHRAPTASNMQQVGFTLVTDPEKLRRITNITLDIFGGVLRKLENPLLKPLLRRMLPQVYRYLPTFRRLLEEQAKGNDLILRGATAVLFIHTPSGSRFGRADANLAYENGSLMAESLGVSQFYTGFVCSAIEQDRGDKFKELLGIEGKIQAGMALGIPAFRFPNYIDKKPAEVKWL